MPTCFNHIDIMGEKVRLRPVRASDVGEEHHLVMDSVRAYATVFVGNVGSRRALEKNGFSLDGTLRRYVGKRDRWSDAWCFTLLRSEWQDNLERYRLRYEEIVLAGDE